VPGLVATGGYPLAHSDPPPPFARDIARSLAGAGFTRHGQIIDLVPADKNGPQPLARTAQPGQESGPDRDAADHTADQIPNCPHMARTVSGDSAISAAAVAAYRISVRTGQPLSERKLAGMFGKTSWRWARNRIAEARESPTLGW
jgi:hypothetical protein